MTINLNFNGDKSLVLDNREYSSDITFAISDEYVKIFLDNNLTENTNTFVADVDINVDFKRQISNLLKSTRNKLYLNTTKELKCYDNKERLFLNRNKKYSTSMFLKKFDFPDYFIIFKRDSWTINPNEQLLLDEIKDSEIVFSYNFNNDIFNNRIFKYINDLDNTLIQETNIENLYEFKSLFTDTGMVNSFFINDATINPLNLTNSQLNYYKEERVIVPNIFNFEFYFNGTESPDKYYGSFFKRKETLEKDLNWTDISNRFNIPILNKFIQNIAFNVTSIDTNRRYLLNESNIHIDNTELLLVEDKYEYKYILNIINDKLYFKNNYFNFNNFLGEKQNSEINLNTISIPDQYSNISFRLEGSNKNKNLFTEGDYLYVKSPVNNTEYRVIATSKPFNYFNQKEHISPKQRVTFKAEDCEDLQNSTIKIILPKMFKFRLLNNIDIIFYYGGVEYKNIIYNIKLNLDGQLTFQITDEEFYFEFLNDEFNINDVEFQYTINEYYYSYFNLTGSPNQILKSVVAAFNSLKSNGYFETFSDSNTLIIKSTFLKSGFEPIYFGYNLNSKTDTENHFINNEKVNVKKYGIYNMNTILVQLFGSVLNNNGIGVFLNDLDNIQLNDRKYIVTKKYFGSFINKYNNRYYSNFLIDKINFDSYKVLSIINNDDIIENNNNTVRIKELFFPKFHKITKF